MIRYYCTLAQARAAANMQSSDTSRDSEILNKIRYVSSRIEQMKDGVTFEPVIATRYYDARGSHIFKAGVQMEVAPLLAVTSITLGDTTVLTGSDYTLLPRGASPYQRILLNRDSGYRWTDYSDDYEGAISIAGTWGWHDNYSAAWVSATTISADVTTTSATTVTVTSAASLSAGHLIKIDSEYLRITNVSSNTLTVTRGQNGSTAATHTSGAAVSYWQSFSMVTQAAARWSAFLISRDGAFQQASFDGVTTVSYPQDAPGDVLGFLNFEITGQWVTL